MIKINNVEVLGTKVAYDGCHRIYVIEDDEDLQKAKNIGYSIFPIEAIKQIYNNSCELRFIDNWKLTKCYATQEDMFAKFEIEDSEDVKEVKRQLTEEELNIINEIDTEIKNAFILPFANVTDLIIKLTASEENNNDIIKGLYSKIVEEYLKFFSDNDIKLKDFTEIWNTINEDYQIFDMKYVYTLNNNFSKPADLFEAIKDSRHFDFKDDFYSINYRYGKALKSLSFDRVIEKFVNSVEFCERIINKQFPKVAGNTDLIRKIAKLK